jgi:hypothetical protein
MVTREMWDAIDAGLAGLRTHDAGAERVERIRARCVAVVEAERRRGRARRARVNVWGQRLEQAAAIALSALYVTAAIGSSLALLR